MSFLEKIQQRSFWINVAKISIPFILIFALVMLFMNSWRDIFAGNFTKVNQDNFGNGKWQRFWGIKIIISFLYGVWMTNKNMK